MPNVKIEVEVPMGSMNFQDRAEIGARIGWFVLNINDDPELPQNAELGVRVVATPKDPQDRVMAIEDDHAPMNFAERYTVLTDGPPEWDSMFGGNRAIPVVRDENQHFYCWV